MNSPQTPQEKLISDKARIQQECQMREQKLNDDFSYIQENAGSLLLSGLSALLFPGTKQSKKTNDNSPASVTPGQSAIPFGLSEYISLGKNMLPLVWDIAQPFIMTWGIKKAQKWLVSLLFKKKR